MDSASVVGWVAALKNAIEVVRGVKDLLPKAQQEVVTQSLEEADRQAQLAEVEIAKTLGCRLCQCTFPPQIMLRTPKLSRAAVVVECPRCHCTEIVRSG
jgi:hypothetical protein